MIFSYFVVIMGLSVSADTVVAVTVKYLHLLSTGECVAKIQLVSIEKNISFLKTRILTEFLLY